MKEIKQNLDKFSLIQLIEMLVSNMVSFEDSKILNQGV